MHIGRAQIVVAMVPAFFMISVPVRIMVMGVMGLLFQLPVVILAITRMGIVTPQQLRKQRRVAILVIGVTGGMLIAGRGKKQPAAERETDGSSSPEA